MGPNVRSTSAWKVGFQFYIPSFFELCFFVSIISKVYRFQIYVFKVTKSSSRFYYYITFLYIFLDLITGRKERYNFNLRAI